MKKLVLLRHGSYSGDHLNDLGRQQIKNLALQLKKLINGDNLSIITSPAIRAVESAQILSSFFGVKYEVNKVFLSGGQYHEDLPKALEIIRTKEKVAVLIIVTHYEYLEKFPHYFGKEELGSFFYTDTVDKGEALVIDYQEKSLLRFSGN